MPTRISWPKTTLADERSDHGNPIHPVNFSRGQGESIHDVSGSGNFPDSYTVSHPWGKTRYATMVRDFIPRRLVNWLEDRVVEYLETHPKVKKFKLHNFRGTAMSRARMAGVSYDDAAVAFGCNPQTMREHYIALDEVAISDRVMEKIQNGIEGDLRENSQVGPEPTEKDLQSV